MSDLSGYVALEVNGEEISLYDVLLPAKGSGNLEFLQEAINAAIIRQEAVRHAIEVSDEELQSAADEFRAAHELYDVASAEAWLAARRLTFEDWDAFIEGIVLRQKLCDAITADKIEQHFAVNKLAFDAAELSRLVVPVEDIARELRAQIVEEGADFHSLARTYSIDAATRLAGGYAGKVARVEMEAAVESAVFGAQTGNVVGPFKLEDGWHLIRIESLHRAELDDALRETIKAEVFSEWFEERLRKARIKIPLLEVIAPVPELEDLAVVNE
jgi:putative peptide maturation system protein